MAQTQPLSTLPAIELLKLGDEGRIKPVLNQVWPQVVGIPMGVAVASFVNFQTRRPIFSGIYKHVLSAAGITGILMQLQKMRDDYFAEKDAVLRHYIELHPDDFPETKPKKIADIMEPWIPVR